MYVACSIKYLDYHSLIDYFCQYTSLYFQLKNFFICQKSKAVNLIVTLYVCLTL